VSPVKTGAAQFPLPSGLGGPVRSQFRRVIPARPGGSAFGAGPAQTTICYVRMTGSDSNGGTSPSDAWRSSGKALATAPPGSIIYVGAGTYQVNDTVTITPTAAAPVSVIGDVSGAYTGDAGPVIWTTYATDGTGGATGVLSTLNGKSFLTFKNLIFVGANTNIFASATRTTNITFQDCTFVMYPLSTAGSAIALTSTVPGPFNLLVDRCTFIKGGLGVGINISAPTVTGGNDYDIGVVIRNCEFLGGSGECIRQTATGALAVHPGGMIIRNCTQFGAGLFANASGAGNSTTIPMQAKYNIVNSANSTPFTATTLGQLVEDKNVIYTSNATVRTNVAVGGGSLADGSYALLLQYGQERVVGGIPRPFLEPTTGSPLFRWGSDGGQTSYDLRNGPRPTGTRQAVGAYQRGNNFGKETGTVHTGSNAISLVGDGFQDFDLAVDAGAITISAYCNYDANYVGPLPVLMVLENGELGVGRTETVFSTAAAAAYAQASVTLYPSAAGILTVRVISGDNSGISEVAFDTFAAA
jgi:hypothetical protein